MSNIVSLIFLIMFMGWGVYGSLFVTHSFPQPFHNAPLTYLSHPHFSYFVTPETLNDRIGLSVTLFLSLVALNFVTNEVP